jgi:hypothetical protein
LIGPAIAPPPPASLFPVCVPPVAAAGVVREPLGAHKPKQFDKLMMNTATTNYQIMLLLLLLLLLWMLAIFQHSSKSPSKLSEFQRIYLNITIVWKLSRVQSCAGSKLLYSDYLREWVDYTRIQLLVVQTGRLLNLATDDDANLYICEVEDQCKTTRN